MRKGRRRLGSGQGVTSDNDLSREITQGVRDARRRFPVSQQRINDAWSNAKLNDPTIAERMTFKQFKSRFLKDKRRGDSYKCSQ